MTRYLINIILIAAICFFGYNWYKENQEKNELKALIENPSTGVPLEAEIIARTVDSAGLNHAIAEASKPILKIIELKVEDKRKVDSLNKVIGIKDNQLQAYTKVTSTLETKLLKATKIIEEEEGQERVVYQYKDRYLTAQYDPSIDTAGAFSFKYDAELNIYQYWKRNWFLGAKKSYLDIWSNDPRVTISGIEKLTIKQDVPQYGLRVQANAVWNPETASMGYGPGLRIDINRFSIQGKYSYFPDLGEWRPMISGNFDVIRF